MEKILTVNDVADILQVKAITVREMFREKRLRGFKVGKAWRITEAMLQEDIDDLARGEAPKTLPTPASAAPEKAAVQGAPESEPAPTREETPAPPAKTTKSEVHSPAPSEDEKDEGTDEDTQQMLF